MEHVLAVNFDFGLFPKHLRWIQLLRFATTTRMISMNGSVSLLAAAKENYRR